MLIYISLMFKSTINRAVGVTIVQHDEDRIDGKPRLLAEDDADVERDCHGEFGVKISSGTRRRPCLEVPGRQAPPSRKEQLTHSFY